MTPSRPEAWLRGPVPGVPIQLQPVAHALVQALEDAEQAIAGLEASDLWASVGGTASVGFHLRHMGGSLDRLFTYARGESLSEQQKAHLAAESTPDASVAADALLARVRQIVEEALAQLRATGEAELDRPRAVGRAGLPSSVRGLLYHAGEHAARHAGQLITTARIVRERRS
jgi:uncharacterized damage-inducible protein DinB